MRWLLEGGGNPKYIPLDTGSDGRCLRRLIFVAVNLT